MAEAIIVELVQAWARAISAKDIESVISAYSTDVVSFDLNPPLRYTGSDHKRRAWESFFAAYPGPVSYELSELSVSAGVDTAFVHSLNRVKGQPANGHESELWVRWTACFRRFDASWLIIHDHASIPVDLAQGRALTTLRP